MSWTTPKTWSVGETLTAANFNIHIRDNLNVVPHLIAVKGTDESVTSSTTLQDDDHLTTTLTSGVTYYLKFVLSTTSGGGDFKWTTIWPSASTGTFSWEAQTEAGHQVASGTAQSQVLNQGGEVFVVGGIITAGATGTFNLQWAQNASNGAPTVLKKGSALFGLAVA